MKVQDKWTYLQSCLSLAAELSVHVNRGPEFPKVSQPPSPKTQRSIVAPGISTNRNGSLLDPCLDHELEPLIIRHTVSGDFPC